MAIQKYGIDNFIVEIQDEASSKEELNSKEILHISQNNTQHPNGYNLTAGGDGMNKPNEDVRKRMREAHLGKPLSKTHAINSTRAALESRKRNARKFICHQTDKIYSIQSEAARELNITRTCITRVLSGKFKKTGIYTFSYIE